MKIWIAVSVLFAWPAAAADAIDSPCYDIVTKADFPSSLLIDKCTGATWGLVPSAPDDAGRIEYYWRQIPRTDALLVVSTQDSRQQAESAAAASALRQRDEALVQERNRFSREQARLRAVLGREPTPLEVDYCVAGSASCPSPQN